MYLPVYLPYSSASRWLPDLHRCPHPSTMWGRDHPGGRWHPPAGSPSPPLLDPLIPIGFGMLHHPSSIIHHPPSSSHEYPVPVLHHPAAIINSPRQPCQRHESIATMTTPPRLHPPSYQSALSTLQCRSVASLPEP